MQKSECKTSLNFEKIFTNKKVIALYRNPPNANFRDHLSHFPASSLATGNCQNQPIWETLYTRTQFQKTRLVIFHILLARS